MNKKLALMTFGIATLGMNSIVLEPVSSRTPPLYMWNYDCYLKSNQKVVGQAVVIAEAPNYWQAYERCNLKFATVCVYPHSIKYLCDARLQAKPFPPMSLNTLPSSSQ